jgi:hypothetical protein
MIGERIHPWIKVVTSGTLILTGCRGTPVQTPGATREPTPITSPPREPLPTTTLTLAPSPTIRATRTPEFTPTPDFLNYDQKTLDFLNSGGWFDTQTLENVPIKKLARHSPDIHIGNIEIPRSHAGENPIREADVLGAGCILDLLQETGRLPEPDAPGEWELDNLRLDQIEATMIVPPSRQVSNPVLALSSVSQDDVTMECALPTPTEVADFVREKYDVGRDFVVEYTSRFIRFLRERLVEEKINSTPLP